MTIHNREANDEYNSLYSDSFIDFEQHLLFISAVADDIVDYCRAKGLTADNADGIRNLEIEIFLYLKNAGAFD